MAASDNSTDKDGSGDVGIVLLEIMGALDFTMIAVALLTAFNTRSVSNNHCRIGLYLVLTRGQTDCTLSVALSACY